MTDEDLMTQAPSLPVLYFDGFGAYRKLNGVLRCVGYTLDLGGQYNLVVSLAGADHANQETRRTLDEKQNCRVRVRNGFATAH